MKILVTGGCGFIGSNLVRRLVAAGQDRVVNLDKLTYSGNEANLADLRGDRRYRFVHGCVTDRAVVEPLVREADAVLHLAAESHVDRSIDSGRSFVQTNVLGTQTILEALAQDPARDGKRFVQVSTDEVYGDLPLGETPPGYRSAKFSESSPYAPSNPYSASKAAADLLVRAYARTFGLDTCIVAASNNFGPYQHPEKVIPRFVTRLLRGLPVPLYGDGANVRDWLHVDDHGAAIELVLRRGRAGETYNVGASNEHSNLELARSVVGLLGLGTEMIQHVADRPGHDRRYAIDATKIRQELGWSPTRSAWPEALASTVHWYQDNEAWWRPLVESVNDEFT